MSGAGEGERERAAVSIMLCKASASRVGDVSIGTLDEGGNVSRLLGGGWGGGWVF